MSDGKVLNPTQVQVGSSGSANGVQPIVLQPKTPSPHPPPPVNFAQPRDPQSVNPPSQSFAGQGYTQSPPTIVTRDGNLQNASGWKNSSAGMANRSSAIDTTSPSYPPSGATGIYEPRAGASASNYQGITTSQRPTSVVPSGATQAPTYPYSQATSTYTPNGTSALGQVPPGSNTNPLQTSVSTSPSRQGQTGATYPSYYPSQTATMPSQSGTTNPGYQPSTSTITRPSQISTSPTPARPSQSGTTLTSYQPSGTKTSYIPTPGGTNHPYTPQGHSYTPGAVSTSVTTPLYTGSSGTITYPGLKPDTTSATSTYPQGNSYQPYQPSTSYERSQPGNTNRPSYQPTTGQPVDSLAPKTYTLPPGFMTSEIYPGQHNPSSGTAYPGGPFTAADNKVTQPVILPSNPTYTPSPGNPYTYTQPSVPYEVPRRDPELVEAWLNTDNEFTHKIKSLSALLLENALNTTDALVYGHEALAKLGNSTQFGNGKEDLHRIHDMMMDEAENHRRKMVSLMNEFKNKLPLGTMSSNNYSLEALNSMNKPFESSERAGKLMKEMKDDLVIMYDKNITGNALNKVNERNFVKVKKQQLNTPTPTYTVRRSVSPSPGPTATYTRPESSLTSSRVITSPTPTNINAIYQNAQLSQLSQSTYHPAPLTRPSVSSSQQQQSRYVQQPQPQPTPATQQIPRVQPNQPPLVYTQPTVVYSKPSGNPSVPPIDLTKSMASSAIQTENSKRRTPTRTQVAVEQTQSNPFDGPSGEETQRGALNTQREEDPLQRNYVPNNIM